MNFYAQAVYLGADNPDAGYIHGRTYVIEVRQMWFGRILVHRMREGANDPGVRGWLEGTRIVYAGLFFFLRCWRIIGLQTMWIPIDK